MKLQKLKDDLELVQKTILDNCTDFDDGGTCNLDSVLIKLPYLLKKDFIEFNEKSSIKISEPLTGWHKGYRFVHFETKGQAALRTRLIENYKRALQILNYNVSIYYQMD